MPIDSHSLQLIRENNPAVTTLDLSQQGITAADIPELIRALEQNDYITALDLTNNHVGDEGAQFLAQHPRLISLDLSANNVTEVGAAALAQHRTLLSLNLSYNQVKDAGAKALAQNTVITSLLLRDNAISCEGGGAFSQNNTLTSLDLADNDINQLGAIGLSQNTTLRSLVLTGNRVRNAGAIALAQNSTLTALTLCHCRIGVEGAKALAENSTLTHLNVSHNQVGMQGAAALAQSKSLLSLVMVGNQISNEGAIALAQNPLFTSLDLSYNQINDQGAIALAKSHTLKHLNLSRNKINFEGAHALSHNTSLLSLDLSYNPLIGSRGAVALAQHPTLTQLDLTANSIDSEGVYALSHNQRLTRLSLNFNGIDDASAIFLARNTTLVELFLSHNRIGDAAAFILAENTTLKVLDVNYNPIGARGREILAKSKTLTTLHMPPTQAIFELTREISNVIFTAGQQDCFWVMDADGNIEFFNPILLRVLGYSFNELLGKPFLELLHPHERAQGKELLKILSTETANYEHRYLCKDGSYRIIRCTSEVRDNHILTIGSDITEEKRSAAALFTAQQQIAQVRLEEAEAYGQRQTEFVAQLCHEIRNPLSGIYGLMDAIQENLQSVQHLTREPQHRIPPAVQADLEKSLLAIHAALSDISVCLDHEKAILDDNVDLTAITQKEFILNNAPLSLNKLTQETTALFSTAAAQKGLEYQVHVPAKEILITGDEARIKQIWVNLINNVVRLTEQGTVEVVLTLLEELPESTKYKVEITGTNTELTAQAIQQRFERFSQTAGSQYGGSSLGLYISKVLAQLMGGEIAIKSEAGKFTGFTGIFQFDNAPAPQLKKGKQKGVVTVEVIVPGIFAPLPVKRRILVVDDNEINRKVLVRQLTRAGYDCAFAKDGIEALESWAKQSFEAILMDTVMPRMDGLTAIKTIRQQEQEKRLPRTPIISLTANALERDRIKGLAAGANEYLTKPVKSEVLCATINAVIGKASKGSTRPNDPADTPMRSEIRPGGANEPKITISI